MTYHPYPQISKMADSLILYQNISQNKADVKICNRLLYIVLESLSNETIKIFVVISLQRITALYV